MKTFKYYETNTNGYLAVKRKLLNTLGLTSKISPNSYQKGQTVYLDQDTDAPVFKQAYEAQGNVLQYSLVNHGSKSWVNTLETYNPTYTAPTTTVLGTPVTVQS